MGKLEDNVNGVQGGLQMGTIILKEKKGSEETQKGQGLGRLAEWLSTGSLGKATTTLQETVIKCRDFCRTVIDTVGQFFQAMQSGNFSKINFSAKQLNVLQDKKGEGAEEQRFPEGLDLNVTVVKEISDLNEVTPCPLEPVLSDNDDGNFSLETDSDDNEAVLTDEEFGDRVDDRENAGARDSSRTTGYGEKYQNQALSDISVASPAMEKGDDAFLLAQERRVGLIAGQLSEQFLKSALVSKTGLSSEELAVARKEAENKAHDEAFKLFLKWGEENGVQTPPEIFEKEWGNACSLFDIDN